MVRTKLHSLLVCSSLTLCRSFILFSHRMSSKESTGQNNVWFGVAMFLIGLIAGAILAFASGSMPKSSGTSGGTGGTAPKAPTAPKASVQSRMIAYAADIGLDEDDFTSCIASDEFNSKINQQMSDGQAAGVSGTPGNIVYDMTSKKGIIISGAQPLANFQKVIDAMLKDSAGAMKQPNVTLAGNVVPVDLNNDHIRGSKAAKIAIIEYSDYECPFCHAVHPTYQKLMSQYDGKVMWVYRHFPLSFHPEAMPLAVGAECANKLGGNDAYWEFSDKVMAE